MRTIERVLERNGVTLPKVRLAPYLSTTTYPTASADESNQLRQVDSVGPIYLKGSWQRYHISVGRDAFDGAVCLKIYRSRKMEVILDFLGECWKSWASQCMSSAAMPAKWSDRYRRPAPTFADNMCVPNRNLL